MSATYKRTIIQVPLEDVKSFENYASKYGLSFSSAIVMLAKKSIEYEETLRLVPDMIKFINKDEKTRQKETKQEVNKIKTKNKLKSR